MFKQNIMIPDIYNLCTPRVNGRRVFPHDKVAPFGIYAYVYDEGDGHPFIGYAAMKDKEEFFFATNFNNKPLWFADYFNSQYVTFLAVNPREYEICAFQLLQELRSCSESEMPSFLVELAAYVVKHPDYYLNSFYTQAMSQLQYLEEVKDWKKLCIDVWNLVRLTIENIGFQFNKELCLGYLNLIAVLIIHAHDYSGMDLQGLSICDYRSKLVKEFFANEKDFRNIYSLFYGRNMATNHANFVGFLENAINFGTPKYLHLYQMAFGDEKSKIERIIKYSPTDKPQRVSKRWEKLKEKCELNEQSTELDTLFSVIFPSQFKSMIGAINSPASYKETMDKIAKLNLEIEGIKQFKTMMNDVVVDYQNDSLPMDKLVAAILNIDDSHKAQMIVMELDWYLSDDPQWAKYSPGMKKDINQRLQQARGVKTMNFYGPVEQAIGNIEQLKTN